MIRRILLVARTIFIEALRRREIYAIVLVTVALLIASSAIRFFNLESLHTFYHEIALKAMSVATALTVIVLAARQLPREFERRTIYTLLAKPIGRWEFLAGKYVGVVAAGMLCLALFMGVFCVGRLFTHAPIGWATFGQFVYLQCLSLAVLAALSFLLSMLMGLDAAITVAMLIYLLGNMLTNALTLIYEYVGDVGQIVLKVLNYTIPQPALFDLSAKVVHEWPPISAAMVGLVTLYALMFIVPYLVASYLLFRRRAL